MQRRIVSKGATNIIIIPKRKQLIIRKKLRERRAMDKPPNAAHPRKKTTCKCKHFPHDVDFVVGRCLRGDEDFVLVEWKCTGEATLEPLEIISKKWPGPIIEYYERVLTQDGANAFRAPPVPQDGKK